MTLIPTTTNSSQTREDWLKELAFLQSVREITFARAGATNDARELIDINCDRFAITAAFADHLDQSVEAAGETAAVGAAAVLVAMLEGGEVCLHWPEGRRFRVPAGGSPPGPMDWLLSVASALIVRDQEALNVLCASEHIPAVSERPGRVDEFWSPFCAAVCAVIRNAAISDAWMEALLDDAESLLEEGQITVGNPQAIRAQAGILIPLLRVLSSGGDWSFALTRAISAYQHYYATEGRAGDPLRLLPIAITGLAALAHDRGISSVGLPDALVRGEFPRTYVRVAFEHHPRFAERVNDPTGFLDLEGYPAANRRHVLGTRPDGELVARYDLSRSGVPHAAIEFILPQDDRARPDDLPPALDPGERLLLAGMYAGAVGPTLREAVDFVDAVLSIIPPAADAVPESAFVNPRGIRAYHEAPGRFRRDRLTAYRGALTSRLPRPSQSPQSVPSPAAPAELQLYQKTMAAAEFVEQNLAPLLDALRKDSDGRIVERLRPRPEDYAFVFEPEFVEMARRAYETVWQQRLEIETAPPQTETRVAASPAGMLLGDNDLSRPFPNGYRSIAHYLNPRRVWVAWRYVEPGRSSGIAYDGLVWCDDHWAWFPKPYRILRVAES